MENAEHMVQNQGNKRMKQRVHVRCTNLAKHTYRLYDSDDNRAHTTSASSHVFSSLSININAQHFAVCSSFVTLDVSVSSKLTRRFIPLIQFIFFFIHKMRICTSYITHVAIIFFSDMMERWRMERKRKQANIPGQAKQKMNKTER